ncbi:MAG: hypothetical protein U0Z17_06635 [Bacteroidales bacterium]
MIASVLLQIVQTTQGAADTAAKAVNQLPALTPPKEESFSLGELIVKGGPIMIPIAILSVVAIYIFIERYFHIRRASRNEANLMNNIRDFITNGRIDSAIAFCKSNESPAARTQLKKE